MKVTDLIQDDHNYNKGSERGSAMIEESIARLGTGRSVLVDKNGKLIAGNKTTEASIAAGIEDAIVVESDGTKLVVVKRTDLDLDKDEQAKLLALADNRTSQVSMTWDTDLLAGAFAELDTDWLWRADEVVELLCPDEELTAEDIAGTSDDKPERTKTYALVFETKEDLHAAYEVVTNADIRCEKNG